VHAVTLPTRTTEAPWWVIALLALALAVVDGMAARIWPVVELHDCVAWCEYAGGMESWKQDECSCHAAEVGGGPTR
jgi:hypothetical protein